MREKTIATAALVKVTVCRLNNICTISNISAATPVITAYLKPAKAVPNSTKPDL
jgi:hypothetical protein